MDIGAHDHPSSDINSQLSDSPIESPGRPIDENEQAHRDGRQSILTLPRKSDLKTKQVGDGIGTFRPLNRAGRDTDEDEFHESLVADEEELTLSELVRRGAGNGDATQAAQQDQQEQQELSSPDTQLEDEADSEDADGAIINNAQPLGILESP